MSRIFFWMCVMIFRQETWCTRGLQARKAFKNSKTLMYTTEYWLIKIHDNFKSIGGSTGLKWIDLWILNLWLISLVWQQSILRNTRRTWFPDGFVLAERWLVRTKQSPYHPKLAHFALYIYETKYSIVLQWHYIRLPAQKLQELEFTMEIFIILA